MQSFLKIKKPITVDKLSFRTEMANAATVKHEWFVIDAEDQILGRMCTRIASVLRGKHKPSYTPHVDTGDYVIVLNAGKFKLTGNKMQDVEIITFSGYPGGQKITNPKDLLQKHPTRMVENCVHGMLPKTKLGRAMHKKLFVYAGAEHPHGAQTPKKLELK
ncbi:MAG: ribosomal protein [Bacteroidota bacterium]